MATCLTRRALARYFQRLPVRRYTTDASHIEPKKGDRVVVGMSGGVDSSVAAKLLADRDYDLSAVFMRNWDTRDEFGTDKGCEWEKDWEDVQQVCKVLDIPCEMIDLSREYWTRVFEPSLHQWEDGVTPNPDVLCNKEIKFGALLEHLPVASSTSTTTWFATGHYARKDWTPRSSLSRNRALIPRPKLLCAADRTKDQTYFLASISEQGLSRSLFPLGDLAKSEVRELAKKFQLPTAERKESMGVCFIGEKTKFSNFISTYIPPKPGPIVDISTGDTVATHEGLWTYTVGQGAKLRGMKEKTFVVKKEPSVNTIYIAHGSDHPLLYCRGFLVKDFAWIWANLPPASLESETGYRARLKIRHRMEPVACTVYKADSNSRELVIKFDEPEKGLAPGQIAVLYNLEIDWVLGCGTIADTVHGR